MFSYLAINQGIGHIEIDVDGKRKPKFGGVQDCL